MTQVALPWMPIFFSSAPHETALRLPSEPSSLTRNLGTTNSEMPFTLSGAPAILASTRWMMFSLGRALEATHGGDVALLHEAVLLFGHEAESLPSGKFRNPFPALYAHSASPGQGPTCVDCFDKYGMKPFDRQARIASMAGGEANDGNRTRVTRTAPRISDVAALAGVSVGTVSKALNGRGQLREQTRERVRAAAEQLGFEPNTVARSLLAGRTYTVGLITTDHYGRFSIPADARRRGRAGRPARWPPSCARAARTRSASSTTCARCSAAASTGSSSRADARTHGRRWPSTSRSPVVYAYAPSADAADCSVVSDEAAGARAAVEHLLETGRPGSRT